MRLNSLLVVMAVLFTAACSRIPAHSPSHLVGNVESGQASFYAAKYQFRRTASGERFNQLAKTAAHRTLPFGTKVEVTNVANGESVQVKINDRGPFVEGRVIDLSRSAFAAIADTKLGVIDVWVKVID